MCNSRLNREKGCNYLLFLTQSHRADASPVIPSGRSILHTFHIFCFLSQNNQILLYLVLLENLEPVLAHKNTKLCTTAAQKVQEGALVCMQNACRKALFTFCDGRKQDKQ